MRIPREAYIRKNSAKIADKRSSAVVYIYTSSRGTNDEPCAIAFHGKADRPDWQFRFRSVEARAQKIAEHFATIQRREAATKHRRGERTSYTHSLRIGDILHYSWGYDQTNCNFYQVTATTAHTVTIREIGAAVIRDSEGFMSERLRPRRDSFLGSKPMVKRVQPSEFGEYVTMPCGIARKCGETQQFYSSWYH